MSPRRGYRKPAPAESLTERIGTTNPETDKKKSKSKKKKIKSQQVYVKTDQLEHFSIWDRVRTNTAF
jgi:hypothetical protein